MALYNGLNEEIGESISSTVFPNKRRRLIVLHVACRVITNIKLLNAEARDNLLSSTETRR